MKSSAFFRQRDLFVTALLLTRFCVISFFAHWALAQAPTINLGARHAGDLLALPASVWTEVNRFVFFIAVDDQYDRTSRFKQLQVYPELSRSCRQWQHTTFATLQKLAARLSKGETRRLLIELQRAIDTHNTDPNGAEAAFGRAYDALKTELGELANLSKGVTEDLENLKRFTEGALIQYKQRGYDVSEPVGASGLFVTHAPFVLGVMNAQWAAISADLESLHEKVKTKLATNDPDLRALYVDFGLNSWENVENSAKRFITDVPQQQKNLSGDYYYDLVPIQEGVHYLMQDFSWSGIKPLKDYTTIIPQNAIDSAKRGKGTAVFTSLPPNSIILRGFPYTVKQVVAGHNPQNDGWMFWRDGHGWWRIEYQSYKLGEIGGYNTTRLFLEVSKEAYAPRNMGGPSYFAVMDSNTLISPSGEVSKTPASQLWRVTPANRPGYVRIYNAALGLSRHLTYRYGIHQRPTRAPDAWVTEVEDWVAVRDQMEPTDWKIQAMPPNGFWVGLPGHP